MVLDLTGGLFKQSDVRETAVADLTSGQRVPIGCILAWWKNNAKTPSIPSGFVECNGQVLNDAESVFDGETMPSLNATNRFLRGNAISGGTGGTNTHVHSTTGHILTTDEMPSHVHDMHTNRYSNWAAGGTPAFDSGIYPSDRSTHSTGGGASHSHGNTGSTGTLPNYYNVVWIIRIK